MTADEYKISLRGVKKCSELHGDYWEWYPLSCTL